MRVDNPLISLDQVVLIPEPLSKVDSRKDVNPFDANGKLPIFVAPMTCIVDKSNYDKFNSKTYAILPVRPNSYFNTEHLSNGWFACPFDHFKGFVERTEKIDEKHYFVCVDMADGHIASLYTYVRKFKKLYPNSEVMVGNIANAQTYEECCKAGVDYVRVGIGGGNGCVTSVRTGFHNSIVDMLDRINEIKRDMRLGNYGSHPEYKITKVVADGGIDSIGKAIKCLALGADYVMMGRMFAQCSDSVGHSYFAGSMDELREKTGEPFLTASNELEKRLAICERTNVEIFVKEYYGQSSEEGQKDRFGKVKSAPEGVKIYLYSPYTYTQFVQQFESYLRSAMSYNGSFTLDEFIGKVRWNVQTLSEFNSYNKY